MFKRVQTELRWLRSELQALPASMLLIAGLSLCIYHYYGSDNFFDSSLRPHLHLASSRDVDFARCLYWCYSPFATLVLFPWGATAAVALAVGKPLPPSGWTLGDWRLGGGVSVVLAAVALVCGFIASRSPDFRSMYPLCHEARASLSRLAIYEVSFALYFVAWESFFRGFLTLGLEEAVGTQVVFLQMLPFVVIHFDKPFLEAASSVFGGVALGILALRTRSFLYGAFLHAAMAICLDAVIMGSVGFHG